MLPGNSDRVVDKAQDEVHISIKTKHKNRDEVPSETQHAHKSKTLVDGVDLLLTDAFWVMSPSNTIQSQAKFGTEYQCGEQHRVPTLFILST